MRVRILATVILMLCGSACSRTSAPAPSPTPTPTPPPAINSLTITGTAPAVGQTAQFTATAALSSGATQDVTAQATWQSSNAAVVTVSSSGMVAGVGFGEADVSAAYNGSSASLHVKLAPRTFTLSGVISDALTGRPIAAEVEVIDGENAGMKTHADGNGFYSLAGLASGSFTIRGRATAYDSRDYRVTISSGDMHVDVALQPAPANYAGVWTGQYMITDCTSIDPPGEPAVNLCGLTRLQAYRFTLSQIGRTVTGSYKLVTYMFSCPCGGDYGTFDLSGSVAPDDALALSAAGYPRASGGVLVNELFNVRLDSASTLTGTLTGTLSLGGKTRGTFSGTIVSGTR